MGLKVMAVFDVAAGEYVPSVIPLDAAVVTLIDYSDAVELRVRLMDAAMSTADFLHLPPATTAVST